MNWTLNFTFSLHQFSVRLLPTVHYWLFNVVLIDPSPIGSIGYLMTVLKMKPEAAS